MPVAKLSFPLQTKLYVHINIANESSFKSKEHTNFGNEMISRHEKTGRRVRQFSIQRVVDTDVKTQLKPPLRFNSEDNSLPQMKVDAKIQRRWGSQKL